MSDLISRNEVLELLYKIFDKYHMSTDKNTSVGKSFGTDVFKEIKEMPTAYSVDKVVEELEKLKDKGSVTKTEKLITKSCVDKAIEIVKAGGINEWFIHWSKIAGY